MKVGISTPSANEQRCLSVPRVLVVAPRADSRNPSDRRQLRVRDATSTVVDWEDTIDGIGKFAPTVILVPIPNSADARRTCRKLLTQRGEIPVVGYAENFWERNLLLREAFADIAVDIADLNQFPLARLRDQAAFLKQFRAGETSGHPDPGGHGFHRSKMIGCLIASAGGVVQWANTCIARWLGYPNASYFTGVNFSRRHLNNASDWTVLAEAADNEKAYACSEISALDVDGRRAAFRIEAMAEPAYSGLLRLLLKNETELQTYKAMAEVALYRDEDERKAMQ